MSVETQSARVATESEIAAMKRYCWNPNCKRKAFIRDWKGWKWCLFCWWGQCQDMSLIKWYIEFKYIRIF